jgi:rSAM/selenodomain-associated transferase 2
VASLSVIVPALDEESCLPRLLPVLAASGAEILVVDGGSGDRTVAVAREVRGVRVLEAERPRSAQLNAGAVAASGEILLFLHADALPPPGFAGQIVLALADPGVMGGAFALALDDDCLAARVVAAGANLRTRITGHPYGDQGIFVRRGAFEQLGGFAPLPWMEDLDFVFRLSRHGRLCLLPQRVTVSTRRWRQQGYVRTTARNTVLAACFYLGLDPRRFAHWMTPRR